MSNTCPSSANPTSKSDHNLATSYSKKMVVIGPSSLLPFRCLIPPVGMDVSLPSVRVLLRDNQVQNGRVSTALGLHPFERGKLG